MQHAVSRRYGQALFAVAQAANKTEAILEQLREIIQVLDQYPELDKLLKSPVVAVEKKLDLARSIWQDRLEPELMEFLTFVISRQRQEHLPMMYLGYKALCDEYAGRIEAKVTSAAELTDEIREQIAQQLGKWTGKQVIIDSSVDPSLLAGIRVQIGDLRIDGSLATKLRNLQAALKGADTSSKGVTFS